MNTHDTEARLDEVLAASLEAVVHGWAPDREQLLAGYPHLAEGLRQYFADQDRVERIVAPLRPTATLPAVPSEPDTGSPRTEIVPGYEVIEELAHGGFGVVYRARQVQAHRVVALKMILAGAHAGSEER